MKSGKSGGTDDLVRVWYIKPGYVIGNGTGKQFNILWQITYVRPETIRRPGHHVNTIKPYCSLKRLPDTDQQPGKC